MLYRWWRSRALFSLQPLSATIGRAVPDPTPEEIAQCAPDLYRVALRLTGDPHLAADLVQDTLIRAMDKAHQYRGEFGLRPWLRRILHNLAIDRARRSAHEDVVEDVEARWAADDYTVDPAVVAERASTREELQDALVRLPFIYRTAVLLHDAEDLTVKEVAEMTGVSLSAAKQRLRRGRMMLVSALARGHERRLQHRGVPMPCWDARQHVSDYLDGVLDHATAHMVEAHLAVCPTCPPLYQALVAAHRRVTDIGDPDAVVPPDLAQRIEEWLASQTQAAP